MLAAMEPSFRCRCGHARRTQSRMAFYFAVLLQRTCLQLCRIQMSASQEIEIYEDGGNICDSGWDFVPYGIFTVEFENLKSMKKGYNLVNKHILQIF